MANQVGVDQNEFLKHVAFTVGSFILPKYMIKCFILNQKTGQEDPKSKVNQAKVDVGICKFIQKVQKG